MIPVVALLDLTHQGIAYHAGDRFDVSPIEALALTFRKKARFASKDIETPKKRSRRVYRRKDLVPEP